AEGEDLRWIAAEPSDVVAHPLERRDLIELSEIDGVAPLLAVIQKIHVAEGAEPMIEADDDHVAAAREALTVIHPQLVRRARRVAAAVNPDEHRSLRAV